MVHRLYRQLLTKLAEFTCPTHLMERHLISVSFFCVFTANFQKIRFTSRWKLGHRRDHLIARLFSLSTSHVMKLLPRTSYETRVPLGVCQPARGHFISALFQGLQLFPPPSQWCFMSPASLQRCHTPNALKFRAPMRECRANTSSLSGKQARDAAALLHLVNKKSRGKLHKYA